MTKITDLLANGRTFSFEFFPPQTEQAAVQLVSTLGELANLHPSFVSVTYGAGGSTRQRTHDIVTSILRAGAMTPMAHLTCVAHTRDELVEIVTRYGAEGVENILALGGDAPRDSATPVGDFTHADELVALVREIGSFSIGVAAHPEVHPRSPDRVSDRRRLADKLARADFAITQFFFRAADYRRLVDELAELGTTKPVIPGIMPVTNVASIERMAAMSGAAVPASLIDRLTKGTTPEDVRRIGVEAATELCAELLDDGAPGLHFYTLNRSSATREIYTSLGLPVA
jgi:methylenetetrahydrofolate reductase (NADPH)